MDGWGLPYRSACSRRSLLLRKSSSTSPVKGRNTIWRLGYVSNKLQLIESINTQTETNNRRLNPIELPMELGQLHTHKHTHTHTRCIAGNGTWISSIIISFIFTNGGLADDLFSKTSHTNRFELKDLDIAVYRSISVGRIQSWSYPICGNYKRWSLSLTSTTICIIMQIC